MEIPRSRLKGYKNCIGQTWRFSAYDRCISKKKTNNIFVLRKWKGDLPIVNKITVTVHR